MLAGGGQLRKPGQLSLYACVGRGLGSWLSPFPVASVSSVRPWQGPSQECTRLIRLLRNTHCFPKVLLSLTWALVT